jgi:hypothetical protein
MSRRNNRKTPKPLPPVDAIEIDTLATPRGTRVVSNVSVAVARDVHSDLTRAATTDGSHAYATALGLALKEDQ